MMSQLEDLFGIAHPIIQAPMVGVSTPRLAAAVSAAGGLGSIGLGASTVEQARAMIGQTRALTSEAFNVNLFCHRPAHADASLENAWLGHLAHLFAEFDAEPPATLDLPYPSFVENRAMLDMLLMERPAVVSFHFGLPPQAWINDLKAAGIRLLATATTLSEALAIERAGLHAVIAQGQEAGGHSGVFEPTTGDPDISTLPLVRQISASCEIPVIAAGGIMDGRGIRAAMALGASGVQMGTAFILCPESAADDTYRKSIKQAQTLETRITSVISGRPARGIVDRWWLEVEGVAAHHLPAYPIAYSAGKALKAAARHAGHNGFNAHWAGQGAALARELPAGELVVQLAKELSVI
ncbi:MAG: nitronate monooxygenase [Alteromonadaceae bacterium]|nr:nitronate monooxygenase [Alteromonadaceae bacterium]MBH84350.1 nitronate monooxygenase [Alteromonadaceae bacterium]|tara:strand:- start:332 stop:1390 length:1059 start_codon:yes stop_codon:yes gene_type:complete